MWTHPLICEFFVTNFLILTSCCWFELGFMEPDAFRDDPVPDSVTRTGTLFIYLFISQTGPELDLGLVLVLFFVGGTRIGT